MPLLSIITINQNDAVGLKKTINSVINQTYTDFEYIIIDGGSTDGSVEIIKENKDHLSHWISEIDKGIYNAMNKGIAAAKGKYLLFLNSGDWLCKSDVLELILQNTDDCDIIYGNQYQYFSDSHIKEEKLPDILTFYNLGYQSSLPHQATLIKRSYIVEKGYYDEKLKIVSDWKFVILSIFKWHCKYKHINHFVTYYNKEGISSDSKYFDLQRQERELVLEKEFQNFSYEKIRGEYSNKLQFYYKYSRLIRVLKILRLLKKFD
jgi:glycosyltransferase involved in cell wall biosynthesis